jgi:hypothetical protein
MQQSATATWEQGSQASSLDSVQEPHLRRWRGPGAAVAGHGDAAGGSGLLLRAHAPAAACLNGGLHPVVAQDLLQRVTQCVHKTPNTLASRRVHAVSLLMLWLWTTPP